MVWLVAPQCLGTRGALLESVPRDDVAALLARLLHDERAAHRVLYVNGGDQPLEQALEAVQSG